MLRNCDTCSEIEKETLRLVIADSLSRVVKETYKVSDNPTERVIKQLKIVEEKKKIFNKATDSVAKMFTTAYDFMYQELVLNNYLALDKCFDITESENWNPTPEKDNGLLFDKSLIIEE